jgi:hypothetical protein
MVVLDIPDGSPLVAVVVTEGAGMLREVSHGTSIEIHTKAYRVHRTLGDGTVLNVQALLIPRARDIPRSREVGSNRSVIRTSQDSMVHFWPFWVVVITHLVVVWAPVVAGVVLGTIARGTLRPRGAVVVGRTDLRTGGRPVPAGRAGGTTGFPGSAGLNGTAVAVVTHLVGVAVMRIAVVVGADFSVATLIESMSMLLVSPVTSVADLTLMKRNIVVPVGCDNLGCGVVPCEQPNHQVNEPENHGSDTTHQTNHVPVL